ncbi:M15 family metallopeptidase [uncultured Robinsoniella sp.]|uniref:M15 family metallopeptidase n=1 Tax=uncultured Robinsoniella sp. TaxID=904190 RepID=UPI00374F999F
MSRQKKKPIIHFREKRLVKKVLGVSVLSLALMTGVVGFKSNDSIPRNETAKVLSPVGMKQVSVKSSDSLYVEFEQENRAQKNEISDSTNQKYKRLENLPVESREMADDEADKKPDKKSDKKKTEKINSEQSDLLVLVNKDHPLSKDYNIKMKTLDNSDKVVAEIISEDLQKMLEDGTSEGLRFCIASAYRSSQRQQEILDQDIKKLTNNGMTEEEAYEQATRTVMPAGYSEHETGLAVDIVALSNQLLDDSQESTPETQWLQENCYKYGFILRYPKDKTDITGIDYESWHYRYVGKEAAAYIKKHDLTFEEYLEEKL